MEDSIQDHVNKRYFSNLFNNKLKINLNEQFFSS